jgi:hypothetical protein
MQIDLAIIGQGAVTPAGVGVDALLHREPTPVQVASLGQPEQPWPVLRIDAANPDLTRWQREPRLRRASPMTLFLIEAAQQALAGVDSAERLQTGLIVAFSAGCVIYSRRFFEGIIREGQRAASPALFPETVFNSPVSHVAAVLGLNSAAYALVGDEAAWVAALKTASVWLRQKRVGQVLVMGGEEFDPLVLDAHRSARWLRRKNSGTGFLASEGAAGILVREARPEDSLVISHAHDGFIYRSRSETRAAAGRLLAGTPHGQPCYRSAQRNWLASLEKEITQHRPLVDHDDQPYLGEAFTASAAWTTLRAAAKLDDARRRVALPVWGLNHQLGLLELAKRS